MSTDKLMEHKINNIIKKIIEIRNKFLITDINIIDIDDICGIVMEKIKIEQNIYLIMFDKKPKNIKFTINESEIDKVLDLNKIDALTADNTHTEHNDINGINLSNIKLKDIICGYYKIKKLLNKSSTTKYSLADISNKNIVFKIIEDKIDNLIDEYIMFIYNAYFETKTDLELEGIRKRLYENFLMHIENILLFNNIRLLSFEEIVDIYKSSLLTQIIRFNRVKKQLLPPISKLLINNVLYIVNCGHGSTHETDETVPENLNVYRIMDSTFGTCAYSNVIQINEYKKIINDSLNISRSKARSRSKKHSVKSKALNVSNLSNVTNVAVDSPKSIKGLLKKMLEKMNIFINQNKKDPKIKTLPNNNGHAQRYIDKGNAHVHYFKGGSKFQSKSFKYNLLNIHDKEGLFIINPKYKYSINLLEYIDIYSSNNYSYDTQKFIYNTRDLLSLISNYTHANKCVYVDLTCSDTKGNYTPIEEKSITQIIEQYNNALDPNSGEKLNFNNTRRFNKNTLFTRY